jgi:hypothetical protein
LPTPSGLFQVFPGWIFEFFGSVSWTIGRPSLRSARLSLAIPPSNEIPRRACQCFVGEGGRVRHTVRLQKDGVTRSCAFQFAHQTGELVGDVEAGIDQRFQCRVLGDQLVSRSC